MSAAGAALKAMSLRAISGCQSGGAAAGGSGGRTAAASADADDPGA